ncbi:hypothetical protein [Bowmanella denitrificans]|uniref:hypothetical protein n=1 Tax=Bowmanella denitrificans TaxID=366582 RepID=UPI000C9AA9E7|nr:hypothetical protein [Bowmanella denitrificans]
MMQELYDEFGGPSENLGLAAFLAEQQDGGSAKSQSSSQSDTEHTEKLTGDITEEQAKQAITQGAMGLTRIIGMATRTDAQLSPLEYQALADDLAPGVVKLWNSQSTLPPWVKQLLEFAPYAWMTVAVGMFVLSVVRKVQTEKTKQAKAKRAQEKVINPTKEDANDGHQSE